MAHQTRHRKAATLLAEEAVSFLTSNSDSLDDKQQSHPMLLQGWDELRKYQQHIQMMPC
jgi:hypothetical protein